MEGDNSFLSHLMAPHMRLVKWTFCDTRIDQKTSVKEVSISLLRSTWIFSMFSGVFSNQADLAPNFAGTYQKWEKQKHPSQVPWWPWPTCWPPSLASLCPPLWVSWPMAQTAWHLGTLVSLSYSWHSWHTSEFSIRYAVFGLTAGVLLFEVVLFSILGKADVQVGGLP